jgi:hypothetical protein
MLIPFTAPTIRLAAVSFHYNDRALHDLPYTGGFSGYCLTLRYQIDDIQLILLNISDTYIIHQIIPYKTTVVKRGGQIFGVLITNSTGGEERF